MIFIGTMVGYAVACLMAARGSASREEENWGLKVEIENIKSERDNYKAKYLAEKGPKWVND